MVGGPVSQPGSRLKVTVQRAAGLRAADCGLLGGKSDPFCVCQLKGKPDTGFETEHIDQTLNPTWDEEHEIEDYERGDDLEFEVLDHDFNDDADLLGAATLSAADFDKEGGFEGELQLLDPGEDGEGKAKKAGPATLCVKVEVLPPKQERELEEVETAGMVATAKEHQLRGREVEVGPAMVYVSEPPPSTPADEAEAEEDPPAVAGGRARPTDCVVLAHDPQGMSSGRHRQLADAFATQGFLAVLPDFSANAHDRDVWYDAIRQYSVDYFLPWLEEQGIEAIICVGFGNGVIPCAHTAKAEEEHLQGGSTVPRFVGTVLAYPELKKPYILNDGELQKMVTHLAGPMLVLPADGDPREVRLGGLLELQSKLLDRSVEFMEFNKVPQGFLAHGDLEQEEVRLSASWALDAACEFCHRGFAASLAAAWRAEHRAAPADDGGAAAGSDDEDNSP